MNVQSLPEYDVSVYSHNLIFKDKDGARYVLVVSDNDLTYSGVNGSNHEILASVETQYKQYVSNDDTASWVNGWSGTLKANEKLKVYRNGTASDIQYNVEFVLPTPEPTPTPEATPTPTTTPEATPEASPEATPTPTFPPNIDVTVVVGEEVVESLNSIQTLNAENKELLATIQEVNNESMAVLYSQYDTQQNFNFAVMALLGLIFGAIFIKGIFYKR